MTMMTRDDEDDNIIIRNDNDDEVLSSSPSLLLDELIESIQEKRALGQYNNPNREQQLRDRLFDVFELDRIVSSSSLLVSSLSSTDDDDDNNNNNNNNNTNPRLDWLIRPFLQAILQQGEGNDEDFINIARIKPPSSSRSLLTEEEEEEEEDPTTDRHRRPILFWLCQWKYLRRSYGWKGCDDMVLMALRFGAKVVVVAPEEQQESLSFSILEGAIQHGSVYTLLHLIKAVQQVDDESSKSRKKLRQQPTSANPDSDEEVVRQWMYREMVLFDIWRKALDRYCPEILRILLRYIPATERVWIDSRSSKDENHTTTHDPSTTSQQHVSSIDYLLYQMVESEYEIESPENMGRCILQLLQGGVTYTTFTMALLNELLFEHSTTSNERKVAQCFFGNWFPLQQAGKTNNNNRIEQLGALKQQQQQQEEECCVICLEGPPPKQTLTSRLLSPYGVKKKRNPMVTLYCGHAFCLKCIREWGSSDPKVLRDTKTIELSCPICRKPLAREFINDENRTLLTKIGDRRRNTLGLNPIQRYPIGPRGPQFLSRQQIIMECQSRGILSTNENGDSDDAKAAAAAVETLTKQWNQVRRQRNHGPPIMIDLGASRTLSPDYVAPKLGVAMIPIRVQQQTTTTGSRTTTTTIPLLAGISGSSPYTVVTPEAVELLGLQVRELASDEFQLFQQYHHRFNKRQQEDDDSDTSSDDEDDDEGFRVKKVATRMNVIDELTITLGDSKIDVKLQNAIVPSEMTDPSSFETTGGCWRPGIVLGLDFLESAAWTQTAVEVQPLTQKQQQEEGITAVGRRFMIILHGGLYIHRVLEEELANNMKEEFRFYAFNGRTFRTPLLHIQPPSSDDDKPSQQQHLFFSVSHARGSSMETTANGGRRKPPAFSECEWCCRMFHYFPSSKQQQQQRRNASAKDNHATRQVGMTRCNFCRDMSSKVFYCDKICQQRAQEAHAHRHGEYYGMLATWCPPVFAKSALTILLGQGHVFMVSFFIGFVVSMLWPTSWWLGQATTTTTQAQVEEVQEEIWAQRSLLMPRVE